MVAENDSVFNGESALVTPSDLVDDLLQDADAQAQAYAEGRGTAPATPSPLLSAELDGGFPVGLTVLHGAPGVGKTAFALQCACEAGCPALFVTTEIPPKLLLLRITARVVGKHWKELRRMRRQELEPLLRRAVEAVRWLLFADFTRYVPKEELWDTMHRYAQAIRAYRRAGQVHPAPYRLMVVDSVHTLVRMANVEATEYDALTVGLTALDAIAKQHGFAILGVAERSRGAMRTGGQSAGAGHRLFEYVSEVVLGLDTPEDRERNLPDGRRRVLLSIHKNRWGDLREGDRAIRMIFDPRTMTFIEEG